VGQPPDINAKPGSSAAGSGWSLLNQILLVLIALAVLTDMVMRWNDGDWPFGGSGDQVHQQTTILKIEPLQQHISQFDTALPVNRQRTPAPSRKISNKLQDRILPGSGPMPTVAPARSARPEAKDEGKVSKSRKTKKTFDDRIPPDP
jgi:hypothetical protein